MLSSAVACGVKNLFSVSSARRICAAIHARRAELYIRSWIFLTLCTAHAMIWNNNALGIQLWKQLLDASRLSLSLSLSCGRREGGALLKLQNLIHSGSFPPAATGDKLHFSCQECWLWGEKLDRFSANHCVRRVCAVKNLIARAWPGKQNCSKSNSPQKFIKSLRKIVALALKRYGLQCGRMICRNWGSANKKHKVRARLSRWVVKICIGHFFIAQISPPHRKKNGMVNISRA